MNDLEIFPTPPTSGVEHLLRLAGTPGVPLAIARADEMMLLLLERTSDLDRATLEYFRSGANMAATIDALVRAAAPDAGDAVLDFGSGYGRVLRFLAGRHGPARFWASDVYERGLAFQAARWGVHTLLSHTDPARFPRARRFRLIFSISVFTHLPEPAFHAWLRTLLACLEPGGVLAFTVHDEAVLRRGEAMPENGLLFVPLSESRSLSTDDYGSTWVTEGFLRAAVERAAPGARLLRLPRAICDYQDLIVVAPPGAEPPPASALPVEPVFFFEDCDLPRPGVLSLHGWTFSRPSNGRPATPCARLTATLLHGGRVLAETSAEPHERPDVREAFGDDATARCGFAFELALPEAVPHAGTQIVVRTTLASGARFVGYAAPLASALLDGASRRLQFSDEAAQRENGRHVFRERHLERDLDAVRRRLAAVESTFTWRARRRLRRAAGLPELAPPE